MRHLLLRSGLFIVDPRARSHTRVSQSDRGHVSGDASGPSRVSLRRRQHLCCLYLNETRLKTQNLHTTMQLSVKVGCSCNKFNYILRVEWFVGTFFGWGWIQKSSSVLPSRPLLHVVSLLKPVPGPSACLSSTMCNFHHLCSGSCNKCTKGTPSCWLAEMWKIGICS